jgi:hypothetical protein
MRAGDLQRLNLFKLGQLLRQMTKEIDGPQVLAARLEETLHGIGHQDLS